MSVFRDEPDWERLPASSPTALRRVLKRALAKESKNRLQHIGDARVEIDDAALASDPEVDNETFPERRGRVWAMAVVAGVTTLSLLDYLYGSRQILRAVLAE